MDVRLNCAGCALIGLSASLFVAICLFFFYRLYFTHSIQKLDFRHKLYALREERVMKPHVSGTIARGQNASRMIRIADAPSR